MNIAYLINYSGSGGSEKYVKILSEHAKKKGHNVIFIYNLDGALKTHMASCGFPIYNVRMSNIFDLSAAYKLSKIFKENKIDLVHVQFPRENYISILSKLFCKVKVIYTCHLLYEPSKLYRILNSIFTPFDKNIFAVCTAVKKLLINNGIKENKISVIYNGIVPNENYQISQDIRKAHNISSDDFLCVTLGRYTEEKGFDFLVRTFEHLKGKAKCIIVGEGPLFDDVKHKIKELGLENTVIQSGFRSNVFDYLKGSDLALNSSNSEAFSFAILEGMSCSLPTVATDVGGNKEMLQGFKACGEIINYDDCKDFAQAIEKLKNDKELYKSYSENALENLYKHFHLDKMIEKTFTIYEEI